MPRQNPPLKLRYSPLVMVLAQVRFSPVLKMADYVPAIQEKLRREGYQLVFGHWARLGLYRSKGITCLDGGCVYGGRLYALDPVTGALVEQALE